ILHVKPDHTLVPVLKNGKIVRDRSGKVLKVESHPNAVDIDIADVDPTNNDKKFSDRNPGYPYGFIIPANWRWPREGHSIMKAYPSFGGYLSYLQSLRVNPHAKTDEKIMHWYATPGV